MALSRKSTRLPPSPAQPVRCSGGTVTAGSGGLPGMVVAGSLASGAMLVDFLDSAIKQHYPKTLSRVPGVDFRLSTPLEKQLVQTFQLNIGRKNELDLTQVNLFDAQAQE